jgi:hypothetical protein
LTSPAPHSAGEAPASRRWVWACAGVPAPTSSEALSKVKKALTFNDMTILHVLAPAH